MKYFYFLVPESLLVYFHRTTGSSEFAVLISNCSMLSWNMTGSCWAAGVGDFRGFLKQQLLPFLCWASFFSSARCSCAVDCVLHEEEEKVFKSGEQPQLLEQRHHHGLLQQTRRGAAQRDTHSGEWGTNTVRLPFCYCSAPQTLKEAAHLLDVSLSVSRMHLMNMETTRGSMSMSMTLCRCD